MGKKKKTLCSKQEFEEGERRYKLYEKALTGDVDALMLCSFEFGMISEQSYKRFLEMDRSEDEEESEEEQACFKALMPGE
jgi:hypothetical protein